MAADKITLRRIETLHPSIRQEVFDMYMHVNNKLLGKYIRLRFSHTYRSEDEQTKLYNQGRTTSGKKVTNAKAGQSYHNYGLAFDIVILYDKDKNGTFEEASWDTIYDGDKDGVSDWGEVTNYFEKRGYKNGFIKNGRKWDLPHFQKTFGNSWRQLKEKVSSGDFTTEIIKEKEYKYVNL